MTSPFWLAPESWFTPPIDTPRFTLIGVKGWVGEAEVPEGAGGRAMAFRAPRISSVEAATLTRHWAEASELEMVLQAEPVSWTASQVTSETRLASVERNSVKAGPDVRLPQTVETLASTQKEFWVVWEPL